IPLLGKFSDLSWLRPGASDVYSVFTEIAADPQTTARIDELLPDLDSDAFHVRDAAGKQLLEMGPPAVLAALRKHPAELSSEQQAADQPATQPAEGNGNEVLPPIQIQRRVLVR